MGHPTEVGRSFAALRAAHTLLVEVIPLGKPHRNTRGPKLAYRPGTVLIVYSVQGWLQFGKSQLFISRSHTVTQSPNPKMMASSAT